MSKRSRAPAMRDVARLAGVAPMTVSRALSGHPSVRAETRKVVVRAANKLGYVHNFMASALLRRGSKLIALVVPNVSNSVFAETIHGLEEVLSAEGYTLTIGHSGYSKDEEERLVRTLLGYGPDGVVLTGLTHTRATRSLLARAGVPIVETWNIGSKPIDIAVGFSNFDAAFQATEFLIRRGRKLIAYAGGTQTDNDRTQAREAGFRAAVAKAGAGGSGRLGEHDADGAFERSGAGTTLCGNEPQAGCAVRGERRDRIRVHSGV